MVQLKNSKSNTYLNFVEKINYPDKTPEYVIIWLHGLGANSSDFIPIIPELNLNACIKFVFPDAPIRPITINNGVKMQAWYDIRDLTRLGDTVDYAGINQSVSHIEELIAWQIKLGFESKQVFLAGFSQGGAIVYSVLLKTTYKLRGGIVLSGYLPDINLLNENSGGVNQETPILACHGKQDLVVPYSLGMNAYEDVKKIKYPIVWRSYTMGHTVSLAEINDISLWLNDKI